MRDASMRTAFIVECKKGKPQASAWVFENVAVNTELAPIAINRDVSRKSGPGAQKTPLGTASWWPKLCGSKQRPPLIVQRVGETSATALSFDGSLRRPPPCSSPDLFSNIVAIHLMDNAEGAPNPRATSPRSTGLCGQGRARKASLPGHP